MLEVKFECTKLGTLIAKQESVKEVFTINALEKGKPFERAGRKATGLTPSN